MRRVRGHYNSSPPTLLHRARHSMLMAMVVTWWLHGGYMLMVSAIAARLRNEDLEDDGAHCRPLQHGGCLCVLRSYFVLRVIM